MRVCCWEILGKDGRMRLSNLSHHMQGESHPPSQTDLTFQSLLSQAGGSPGGGRPPSEHRLQATHRGLSCHLLYGLGDTALGITAVPRKHQLPLVWLWSLETIWLPAHTYWWAHVPWLLLQKSRGQLRQHPLLGSLPARSCYQGDKNAFS